MTAIVNAATTQQRTYEIWGNWKMNPTVPTIDEASKLAGNTAEAYARLIQRDERFRNVGVGIFVPHGLFIPVGRSPLMTTSLGGALLQMGVQNMHYRDNGAFTGEHSPIMVTSMFEYLKPLVRRPTTLIGHSERRDLFGESDEMINQKMQAAYRHGIRPFLAVGEQLTDRDSGKTNDVLEKQLREALMDVSAETFRKFHTVIAYEPVWAIGTGRAATPEIANDAHAYIRSVLADKYGKDVADKTTIQYGGSMKPENAAELLSMPHIDGGLIGGASLSAASFMGIVSAVPKLA